MEPANQLLPTDTARPNGALGPAYLVGALRTAGIEADYFDGTVGWAEDRLEDTFFKRVEQENGTVRYGVSLERLAQVFSGYDVIALSSIFTSQTRMHFEAIGLAKSLGKVVIAGGVNARALWNHFIHAGCDWVIPGDGEAQIVAYAGGEINWPDGDLDALPPPALDSLPLDRYRDIGISHSGILPDGVKFGAIQTSRGCQDRCSFCHISMEKEEGMGFLRKFSVERVGQDVDRAVALGITRLYFEDDNLFFSKRRLYDLAPVLRRPGLEYSNVNGANLRFLFKNGKVDTEFIELLASFPLKELVLPFESRNPAIMTKYATGKYNPEIMDSAALVRALKDAGIRIAGNFMIGFEDETWESVLRTKEFARELLSAGLDAVGFMIPVPYPGSLDFERRMQDQETRESFNRDPLSFTDRMHWRAKPLFPTAVDGDRLAEAVRDFWMELNPKEYVGHHQDRNVSAP